MKRQSEFSVPGRIFLLSLLVAANLQGEVVPSAPSAGGLTIDPNPAICFLELDFHGELGTFRYSFLGDGRVNIDTYLNSGDLNPADRWRAQLSNAELRTLVSDLVESGLYAFDPEAQLERELKAGIRRPIVADGGWVEIGVSLVRRSSSGQDPAEVVARHFGLSADLTLSMPTWLRFPGEHPVIPELEAYQRLAAFSSELRRRAERIPPPRPVFRYSFPQDHRPVLVLTAQGMQMPFVASLSLYASGTAVIESSLRTDYREVVLAEESRDRVLRDIDEGGLALYDEKAVAQEQKRLAQGQVVANSADSPPAFTVQLRVLENSGTGTPPEELSRTMVVLGPDGLAQQFPSIPAFKAIADLEQLLWEMESFARNPP